MTRVILTLVAAVSCGLFSGSARAEDDAEKCLRRRRYAVYTPCLPPPNPVVYDSGRSVSGVYTGPLGIRYQVHTERERVHASALDPNRDVVDAGSLRYVDHYVGSGANYHREQGYHWTSNGVPHSDVSVTNRYRTSMFGSRVDHTHVAKEIGGGDDQ